MATDSEPVPTQDGTNTVLELVIVYLKGLAMGTADAVPGVSGGTIALITGIYERLVRALTAFDPSVIRYVPRLYYKESREEFRDDLIEMDFPFLAVLGMGMFSAVVVLARLVQFALSTARGPTFAFFFGLIGASAIILGRREWLLSPAHLGACIAGGILAFFIAGASGQGLVPHTLPVVFFAGMVAISGMVLPGISGAFILLLLGQYDPMTAALNGFIDGLFALGTSGVTDEFRREGTVVVTFIAGAFVGLFTVAYVVKWALDRNRTLTLAFLVSLMLGALRLPVIEVTASTDFWEPAATAGIVLATACGIGAILALNRYTDDLDY